MGQAFSKRSNPLKNYRVIPDSPLGTMLKNWENHDLTKDKDQIQMIQYCVIEWPKKKLREDGLMWPRHGSTEPLLCKALYLYLHYKGPKKIEQLEYAKIWLKYWEKEETNLKNIFALKDKSKLNEKKNKIEGIEKPKQRPQKQWDPLSIAPCDLNTSCDYQQK